ncbi:MAG: FtsW/RodA/SpoVE family cell cycle protein [Actinobacteria bacterium]|nr:FtsW/RodA/SpoVE family cell cycle protein [Actinomycetota bacterium]
MSSSEDISNGSTDTANWLAVVAIGLMFLGVVMVYSAGALPEIQPDWRQFWKYASLRQIVFVPLAITAMLLASCWPMRWWRINNRFWVSPSTVFLAVVFALLILVLIPGIGVEVNGARRWLRIGSVGYGLGFQPSELAKISLVVFLAAFYARPTAQPRSFLRGFLPGALVVGLITCLIAKEDFGTGALVAFVGVLLMAAAGVRLLHLLSVLPPAALAFYKWVYCVGWRWQRFTAFLNPQADPTGSAYHARQSQIAIASGGWRGLGLGQGVQKYGYVPEDTTDFIFAIIGEELGLIGCALVIGAFIILLILAVKIASRCPSILGRLLAFGLAAIIGLQAAIHIGVDLGVLPTKGISLPFVSAGGSGLILMSVAVGLIMSVARSSGTSEWANRSH